MPAPDEDGSRPPRPGSCPGCRVLARPFGPPNPDSAKGPERACRARGGELPRRQGRSGLQTGGSRFPAWSRERRGRRDALARAGPRSASLPEIAGKDFPRFPSGDESANAEGGPRQVCASDKEATPCAGCAHVGVSPEVSRRSRSSRHLRRWRTPRCRGRAKTGKPWRGGAASGTAERPGGGGAGSSAAKSLAREGNSLRPEASSSAENQAGSSDEGTALWAG